MSPGGPDAPTIVPDERRRSARAPGRPATHSRSGSLPPRVFSTRRLPAMGTRRLRIMIALAWAGGVLAAVGAAGVPAPVVLPAASGEVTRLFDPPALPWARGHRGVDLAAGVGARVVAPTAGEIVFVGRVVDRDVVTVRHADGALTSLEPVAATVAVGEPVERGGALGTVTAEGAAHCSGGCLH